VNPGGGAVTADIPPRSVSRAATTMGFATLLSRVVGFVRVLVIAAVLGTTFLGNTFQASNSMSNVLFELLAAGALSAVLVPTFVRLLDAGEHEETERVAGALLGLAVVALGAVSVVGIVFAPAIARALTSGGSASVAHDQRVLCTFLLRFFIPQVVLYAAGTIAVGVLQAQRRFALPALAPIGNTLVMVAFLVAFHAARHGQPPSLHLSTVERLDLAAGGTLGVAAFVGIPLAVLWAGGFRLRPRWDPRHARLRELVRLSSWGIAQHAGTGVLLATALVVGNGVAGGVVAYQVAFVFFLVPYAVVAQPIHTAILPEMAADVARGDVGGVGSTARWALSTMAFFVVPGAALMVALALPTMRVLAFGQTGSAGAALIAAALGGLAAGLPAYGGFLLLSRAYYALGDSRTPALAAITTALAGAVVMGAVATRVSGSGRVIAMGLAHSGAYAVAAAVLAVGLGRRTGTRVVDPSVAAMVVAGALAAAAAWGVVRAAGPSGRVTTAVVLAGAGLVALGVYWPLARRYRPGAMATVG